MTPRFQILFAVFVLAGASPVAKPITFDFKDPKNVNNVIFQMDAPLESINGSGQGIAGKVVFDPAKPESTLGTITLEVASLHVGNPVLKEHIHDVVDHAFVVFEGDSEALIALSALGNNHKTLVVPFIPTAENLAKWAYSQVASHISSAYGNNLCLAAFHVRETPKSWASWIP